MSGRTEPGPSMEAEAILDAIHKNEVDALVLRRGDAEKVFALRSIDDLNEADTELRNLARRFETLANHAPVGIFITDSADKCVYLNQRGCKITGVRADAALGRGLFATLHEDDRDRVLRDRSSAVAEGTAFEGEYRYRHPGGTVVWVAARSAALKDEEGKSLGRIGTLTDISELKRAESELLENRSQLQKLLEDRERLTQDLHDGCIQSIYAIGLNLQSSRQLLDGNPQAARLVAGAAASLNLVIQELRSFIGGLGASAAPKPDLHAEIARAGEIAREQGLAFDLEIDQALANLLDASEAMHLLQIAREAISNATRHAKARSVRVRLGARDGSTRLEIRDDGVGFDPRAHEKSGLGLHHIDARARALRGKASIQSSRGKGTRVVVRIPLV